MTVLICGGRDYNDRNMAFAELDKIHHEQEITKVIHGDARGADTLGNHWARLNNIPQKAYPADWRRFGRSAGFIRNKAMIQNEEIDRIIAFPGGNGTEHMISVARQDGIKVLRVGDHPNEFNWP